MRYRLTSILFIGLTLSIPSLAAQEKAEAPALGTPGQFSLAGTVGWDGLSSPIGMVFTGEVSVVKFNLGPVVSWLGAMGCCSEYYQGGSALAVGGEATAHAKLADGLSVYAGFGPDVILTSPRWGFAQTAGLVWMLNDHFGLQAQEHYVKNMGSSGIIFCGIGAIARLN
jgi:hypothetical protein